MSRVDARALESLDKCLLASRVDFVFLMQKYHHVSISHEIFRESSFAIPQEAQKEKNARTILERDRFSKNCTNTQHRFWSGPNAMLKSQLP